MFSRGLPLRGFFFSRAAFCFLEILNAHTEHDRDVPLRGDQDEIPRESRTVAVFVKSQKINTNLRDKRADPVVRDSLKTILSLSNENGT